jgi:hypothetical protein
LLAEGLWQRRRRRDPHRSRRPPGLLRRVGADRRLDPRLAGRPR